MLRKTLAALAFTALTLSSAQALTIDDFSTTLLLTDPGTPSGTVIGAPASIIGTEREANIDRQTGSDAATLAFNSGGTGTMSIANGTGGTSISNVVWDGVGAAGLGGVDLTVGGTQNALDLRIIANDFAADINIRVIDTFGTINALTLTSPGGIPGPASIPMLFEFASFTGPGTVDFTLIDFIELEVDTQLNNATDIELDFFGTTNTDVPEPATLAVLGLGLAGLGFARRRRA